MEFDWRRKAIIPSSREIHVWCFSLDGSPAPDLDACIQESERVRAARFAFARDRTRFLRARYVLRQLLGQYLGAQPQELSIQTNEHGKPFLADAYGLSFNLSHSGSCGMLAIGNGFQVGVDVEEQRTPTDIGELAKSVFSEEELSAIDGLSIGELGKPFLTCWTRKEAYLKALGVGLIVDPRSVSVGMEPTLRRVTVRTGLVESFVDVMTIIPEGRYVASIAAVGGFSGCRVFELDDTGAACTEEGAHVDRHLARCLEHKCLESLANARVSFFPCA
ncbi:MAG: 4'-phosphopantetheinyl transferase superfamily protein [Usitatibacteraceae bacterium]